ncbi:hypothetical protein AB1Y20_014233 [Prymnesium parvum]|uniref:CRAL-TRIO domain-containing protein n=1 Tax=Prymnesium parvum TaxID=97485 RepID=A0AB34IG82_PRYPA
MSAIDSAVAASPASSDTPPRMLPAVKFDATAQDIMIDFKACSELPFDPDTGGVKAFRAIVFTKGKGLHVPDKPGHVIVCGEWSKQEALCLVHFAPQTKRDPQLLLNFVDYGYANNSMSGVSVESLPLPLLVKKGTYQDSPQLTRVSDVAGFTPIDAAKMPWAATLKPCLAKQALFKTFGISSPNDLSDWLESQKMEERVKQLVGMANSAMTSHLEAIGCPRLFPSEYDASNPLHPPIHADSLNRLRLRYGQDLTEQLEMRASRSKPAPAAPRSAAPPAPAAPHSTSRSKPSPPMAAPPRAPAAAPPHAPLDPPPPPAAAPSAARVGNGRASPAAAAAAPAAERQSAGGEGAGAPPPSPRRDPVLVKPQNANPALPNMKAASWLAAKDALDKQLKSFAPVDLDHLPDEIQGALAYIRAKGKESRLAISKEMGHDVRMLRFLIGQKWDVKAAGDEYVAALKKREELKLDTELRDKIVKANSSFFVDGGDQLMEVHFHPSSAESARLIPRLWVLRDDGPGCTLLKNRGGHLLVVDQAPDFDQITAIGSKLWHESEIAFNELQMLILDELSYRSGNLMMACKVTDVNGRETALARSLLPNPMAPASEKQFKATASMMKNLYPTVVYKWFMINLRPSYKGKVQTAIESFGGRSKHKMIVCDSAYHDIVYSDIDPSQLPTSMGGVLTMG